MYLLEDTDKHDQVFEHLFRSANGHRLNSGNVSNYGVWLTQSQQNLDAARNALPHAREYLAKINQDVGVFIDNIDESLEAVCDPQTFQEIAPGIDSTEIWVSAQLGLIDAIAQYRKINAKVRISATVRIEAYKKYPTAQSSNIEEFCEELSYSKEDLRRIFDLNVELEKAANLVDPMNPNAVIKFFGTTTIQHDRVLVNCADPVVEDVFGCLLRHTLGRPRDLMRICGHISEKCNTVSRVDKKLLREAIRQGAAEVLSFYKLECFPKWDTAFDVFLDYLPSNIVSNTQLDRMANAFEQAYPSKKHPACYFYQRGLIGTIREKLQYFLPPNTYLAEEIRFPKQELFFVHPAMTIALNDAQMNSKISKLSFSDIVICGNGSPVPDVASDGHLLPRLKFGRKNGVFWFELDGVDIALPSGNSNSRLLLASICKSILTVKRTDIKVLEDLNPAARDVATEFKVSFLGINPNAVEAASLLDLFLSTKDKGGVTALKDINKALNNAPLCCSTGRYVRAASVGLGKGPITHEAIDKRKNTLLHFDVCTSNEIVEIQI